MRQIQTFTDDRLAAFCVYCGGPPDTRDHVPARVFLDEPYPTNLPIVGSCRRCNEGASSDEEYVACLLEVAACGSASPSDVHRPKIARKLSLQAALARRVADSIVTRGGEQWVSPEHPRVDQLLDKVARGLWAFETGEPTSGISSHVIACPLASLSSRELKTFENIEPPSLLPEVGSRMMIRVLDTRNQMITNDWQVVQPGRIAYAIDVRPSANVVKMVIRDYLAIEVELRRDD